MDDNDTASSGGREPNYLHLLQEMERLEHLANHLKRSHPTVEETLTMPEIERIFTSVTENVEIISNQMAMERRMMFIVWIFNTMLRLSAIDEFDVIVSRMPFQSLWRKVNHLTHETIDFRDLSPTVAYDMLDSMLMNLAKDNFIGKCSERLLSAKPVSITGSILQEYTHQEILLNRSKTALGRNSSTPK